MILFDPCPSWFEWCMKSQDNSQEKMEKGIKHGGLSHWIEKG